ncbi:MAG: hypothetical protein GY928_05480 [Colwellia sp.]|nr:hypothetical protein [Colwellia sp.]
MTTFHLKGQFFKFFTLLILPVLQSFHPYDRTKTNPSNKSQNQMGLMPKNVTQSLNRTARPTITTGGGPQNDPANGVPNKTIRTNIEGNDYGGNGAYYSLNVSITTTAYDRQDSSTPQGLPWSDSGRLSPNSLF